MTLKAVAIAIVAATVTALARAQFDVVKVGGVAQLRDGPTEGDTETGNFRPIR